MGKAHKPRSLGQPTGPTLRAADGDEDSEFTQLMATFERHCDLQGGDEVADRMRPLVDQPASEIARWIVSAEILTIVHDSATFVPMFQVDRHFMDLRAPCREAVVR
jgi:hypothetical protein